MNLRYVRSILLFLAIVLGICIAAAWGLMACLDLAEQYAPGPTQLRLIIVLIETLSLGALASIGILSRRRNKKLSREKRDSDAKVQAITNAAQDAIIMIDTEGLISYWNPAAERMFGYTAAEAMRHDLKQFLVPHHQYPAYVAAFSQIQQAGQGDMVGRTLELEAQHRDGRKIPIAMSLSSLKIGDRWHAVGILRDETERKRAEVELRKAKEEVELYALALESSNQAIDDFYQMAESAIQAKNRFSVNMGHQTRTLLTAILGYADILLQESTDAATRERVEVIKCNGTHLLELIDDVLDLSKVESGRFAIDLMRCSPHQLLVDVLTVMKARADAKHLNLEAEVIGSLPEAILADPVRLKQLLMHLVDNAIKFTEQGDVRVTAIYAQNATRPQLRFMVGDTGVGMSKEQLGRLFEAFANIDTSSGRRLGGTGLGLCISKRFAELLGGDIKVQSTLGRGSTFDVTIDPGPMDGVRMAEDGGKIVIPPLPTATPLGEKRIELHCRILLAEDGPDNQRLLGLLLRKAGADVHIFKNGSLAVNAAMAAIKADKPFDVILMDMQMPVMDGYEATRRLRTLGYERAIIAITAHAMSHDRKQCLDAGCNDYLTKPIDQRNLLETIAKYLPSGEPGCVRSPQPKALAELAAAG